ncbi:beta-1,4-galactosyltransferase 7-like [Oppia nitens]|uniref:beta-1,4-galactosyltransferase 7-like n=1 Tax=Oppia nitens TaxID=1686743 RepID=UPI0023DB2F5E|nr:beta-1,4-galactosyltransferase 7-like [Oppia nitens]
MMVTIRSKTCAKLLIICLLSCLILTIWISIQLSPILTMSLKDNTSDCKCQSNEVIDDQNWRNRQSGHRLAVVVPFRDRFDELLVFVPHLTQFLKEQQIDHKIFVINQKDIYRFNRASLINVGFLMSRSSFDYMVMHDVDLLPLNTQLSYRYPIDGPFHVAAPHLHPKYHYKTFVGGILIINREHFERVNGLSNNYWGWGLEDDEFYARLKEANLAVSKPEGINTGINDTFRHIHNKVHKRDTFKIFNQREITRRRDRKTGLNTVNFRLLNVNQLSIDNCPVTLYNVQLICDISSTPWCQTKESLNKNRVNASKS